MRCITYPPNPDADIGEKFLICNTTISTKHTQLAFDTASCPDGFAHRNDISTQSLKLRSMALQLRITICQCLIQDWFDSGSISERLLALCLGFSRSRTGSGRHGRGALISAAPLSKRVSAAPPQRLIGLPWGVHQKKSQSYPQYP
jgi:hypothetical protein